MSQDNPNTSPEYNYMYEEDEEPIDWAAYISKFILNWKKIVIISCIFGAIGIVVALCQKREYSVAVTLAPEVQGGSSSGSLGGIASMLGMGGFSMGTSSDALNISLFPDICSSTPFLTQLFDVKLSSYVSPKDTKKGIKAEDTNVYMHVTGKDKPKGFLSQMMENIFGPEEETNDTLNIALLTKEQNKALLALKKAINANVDKKTGVTTLSVTMDDPLMATELADTVCSRLQNYIYLYRTRKERENFDYYSKLADEAHENLVQAQNAYASSMDFDRDVSLLSLSSRKDRLQQEADMASQIYTQMVQQRELARAKVQEIRPVFAVVEPATLPQKPNKSRKNTVLAFGFVGFFLSAAWFLLGKDFVEENLKQIKEKMVEIKVGNPSK